MLAAIVVEQFLADYQVDIVATIADAQTQLARERYDVVLVDYDLPDGKGDALVSLLCILSTKPLVIAVSARPDGNARLLAEGAHVACPKAQLHRIAHVIEARRQSVSNCSPQSP